MPRLTERLAAEPLFYAEDDPMPPADTGQSDLTEPVDVSEDDLVEFRRMVDRLTHHIRQGEMRFQGLLGAYRFSMGLLVSTQPTMARARAALREQFSRLDLHLVVNLIARSPQEFERLSTVTLWQVAAALGYLAPEATHAAPLLGASTEAEA